MNIRRKRRLQHEQAREEMIERLGGKMPEDQNGVSIELTEKEASMLEKALNNKGGWDKQEQEALRMLNQIRAEQAKAQGKIDGAIELITEVKGYEFDKTAAYSVDTKARFLILSFQEKNPEPDKEPEKSEPKPEPTSILVAESKPEPEQPETEPVVKEEQAVGSG